MNADDIDLEADIETAFSRRGMVCLGNTVDMSLRAGGGH